MGTSKFLNSAGFLLTAWLLSRMALLTVVGGKPGTLFETLYSPFLKSFVSDPSFDPWTNWLTVSSSPDAFPYGWPMLLILSLGEIVGTYLGSAWLGFLSILLLIDLAVCLLLMKNRFHQGGRINFAAVGYLLSPLPVLAIFVSGSTDLLPMLLLLLAVFALGAKKPIVAGILLGAAVGSKLILAVALVGAVLYFFRAQKSARSTFLLASSFLVTASASISPAVYSRGFRQALESSSDATGPLSWGIPSPSGRLLFLPLVVFAVWFAIYQLRRMNNDLLALAIATPLMVTASLPGAPVGWALWSLPIVLVLTALLAWRFKVLAWVAVNATSIVYALEALESAQIYPVDELEMGIITTGVIAVTVIATILLWREHYIRSDFTRLHSRPALVLIAGDSGVGKDTLAEGLAKALGLSSTVHISGDDYHRWDRGHGSWDYVTHLNPSSNELPKFFDDILTLADGGAIQNGKYDHRVGRRLSSRTARGREFVIASGLHALHINDINKQATLSVFLDMGVDLRTSLKVARDTQIRGHEPRAVIKSLEDRARDSQEYIQPQRASADLVVRSDFIRLPNGAITDEIELEFESENKIFDSQLLSELGVTCGLEVSINRIDPKHRKISVRGSASPDSLTLAFERLEPRVSSILGRFHGWSDGPSGIVQMVTMVYLANALRRERLVK